jgi:hypothetical protein
MDESVEDLLLVLLLPSSFQMDIKSSSEVDLGFVTGLSSGEESRRFPEFVVSKFKSSSEDCLCLNRLFVSLSSFNVGSAIEGAGGLVGLVFLGFLKLTFFFAVLVLYFILAALMNTLPLYTGTFERAFVTSNHTYVFL